MKIVNMKKKKSAKRENRKKVKDNHLIMNMEAQENGIVHLVKYTLKVRILFLLKVELTDAGIKYREALDF